MCIRVDFQSSRAGSGSEKTNDFLSFGFLLCFVAVVVSCFALFDYKNVRVWEKWETRLKILVFYRDKSYES